MKKTILLVTLLLTMATGSKAVVLPEPVLDYTAPADTTKWGEDDDDDDSEKVEPTRLNTAKGFNARDYIMETRFIPDGETFALRRDSATFLKKLTEHMFVQVGVGMEKILPPPSTELEIDAATKLQVGVGKHLSRLHTLRLEFDAALGNERWKNRTFQKMSLKLDHLYSLSSYMAGYNPSRLMDLSTLFGVGLQHSKLYAQKDMSFEVHAGLMGKFFTGPHAYIYAEPYVGMATDQVDLSQQRNWRGIDFFYGVNVGLIYYLHNNLSPESRFRIIENRRAHNEMSADSVLSSWQQPWVVQLSAGPALMSSPRVSMGETLGSEISLSVGKWLSPVIGFRGTLSSRVTVWNKQTYAALDAPYHPAYEETLNNLYRSARIETMINPIGFLHRFDWNAPWGFYVAGGLEYGELNKQQYEELNCKSLAYCAGLNIWWQPTEGLKFFIEPRYSHLVYRIPYTNVNWYGKFADDNMTLNIGIAVETRDIKRWYNEPSYEYQYLKDPLHRLTFGLGGGTHLFQTTHTNAEKSPFGFNGLFFAEYHFNRVSSARLGVEFLSLRRTNLSDFIDYNMENPTEDYSPVHRFGLWSHEYNIFAISPAFQANISQLFFGYQSFPLKLHAFIGPTAYLRLKPASKLSETERLMENHVAELDIPQKMTLYVGAHAGLKLDYRLNRHLGVFLSPTFYSFGNADLPGLNLTKLKLAGTLNIGVQYSLLQK